MSMVNDVGKAGANDVGDGDAGVDDGCGCEGVVSVDDVNSGCGCGDDFWVVMTLVLMLWWLWRW